MMKKFIFLAILVLSANYVYAQESWFHPDISIRGRYDDNIFLTRDDETGDWITTISPGFSIENPNPVKHKFSFAYGADLHLFAEHDSENTYNHTVDTELEFNFNKVRFAVVNMFHYFTERSGVEDVNRVPRTQDHLSTTVTLGLNKLDLSLGYHYRLENYRSQNAIGNFLGRPLTYEDLERDETEAELELAWKLWPKTALLVSGLYGSIDHDSGNKSDSDYFDFLVGLRGKPTEKCTLEAKIGYRDQNYEDFDNDFSSIVFKGSLTEKFTSRDTLRLDFLRTTEDTIYLDNAYYKLTNIGAAFSHGFTDRVFGDIGFSYQRNSYPAQTTEDGETAKRKDDYWSASVGLNYKMPKWFVAYIEYEHRKRSSEFSVFDYDNNLINLGLRGNF